MAHDPRSSYPAVAVRTPATWQRNAPESPRQLDAAAALPSGGEKGPGSAATRDVPTAALASSALAGGWLLLGLGKLVLVNACSQEAARLSTRLLHHAIELGRHAGVGFGFALLAQVWLSHGPRSALLRACATTALGASVGALLLREDLAGFAQRTSSLAGLSPAQLMAALIVSAGLAVAVIGELSLRAARGFWKLVPAGLGAVCLYLDSTVSPLANPGPHFFLSWMSALAVSPLVLPFVARWRASGWSRGRRWLGARACLLLWFCWAVLAPQRHSVQIDIARWPGNLAALRFNLPSALPLGAGRTNITNPYFVDRRRLPPLPSSADPLLPPDAIVLLISIDSFRADVLLDPEQAAYMPTVSRLRAAGVSFDAARAPGSQTVVTLAGLSTGRYFSQQYWTQDQGDYEYWPRQDQSRHLASELSAAGVRTVAIPTAHWMENEWGLLRGFRSNEFDPTLTRWAEGQEATDRLLQSLAEDSAGPQLLFTHYLDSHAPFSRGGSEGEPKQRYLKALGFVDSEIARIALALEQSDLLRRTLFIITGDHGEAFGEHNMYFHGNTLYDELLRVPLLFSGLDFAPARVSVPVSLVDLAPTLLDLHGLATPASYMGQSLAPLLRGEPLRFERPIAAEGLLRQSMVFEDGYKVIRDQRAHTVELFDLSRDPGERHNLSDDVDLSTEEHLLALDYFFRIHTYTDGGYQPPLRK